MPREKKQLTKRDLQAIERRDQLLKAAAELFAVKGYHATPIREISREIGMADGLLYHYFPGGKLEILQTIVEEAKDRRFSQIDAFTAELDVNGPLEEIILEMFRFLYTMMTRERTILKIQIHEAELLAGETTRDLEQLILERTVWVQDLLERRIQSGELRQMDPKLAAQQFISVSVSVTFQSLTGINLIQQGIDLYFKQMSEHLYELLPRVSQHLFYSWVPLRFSVDGLRDLFYFRQGLGWPSPAWTLALIGLGSLAVLLVYPLGGKRKEAAVKAHGSLSGK